MLVGLNWADIIIAGTIFLSILISVARGFVREALSLLTWIFAFWVAFSFSGEAANHLASYFSTPSVRAVLGFTLLFIGSLIAGGITNHLIVAVVEKTGLTGTDRLLGIIFGFMRGFLLMAVLLLLAEMTPLQQDSWWKDSLLIPRFKPLETWLHSLLPKGVSDQFVVPNK